MARIYISSTFEDLKDYRKAVNDVLRRQGHSVVCMEDYLAQDARPVDRCTADARSADLYVGIFGFRYGYVPEFANNSKSITELEYRAATDAGRPRLCFLLDPKAPWPTEYVDEDRTAVKQLRGELEREHSRMLFQNSAQLAGQVLEAVIAWGRQQGAPDQPTSASQVDIATYGARIAERYGRVELDALMPPERDEQFRVPLDDIYVEQEVRPNQPPLELPKELWEKLAQGGISDEDVVSAGVSREQLTRAKAAFRDQPPLLLFDALAGNQSRLVVLLGDPGSGKSTLTRSLLLLLLSETGNPRVKAAYPSTLPVLVELRKYVGLRAEGRCNTFHDYFDLLSRTEACCPDATALAGHLQSGLTVLFLFDGLDEIFEPSVRELITNQIAGFAAANPSARAVVTSRTVGYSQQILFDCGFSHFTIQDLGRSQISAFLEAWFSRVLQGNPIDAKARTARILAALDDSRSIAQLARNPLLLTIMAIIGKNQELPRERVELYQHAASVLVEHWDVRKHLSNARLDTGHIDRQEKFELLRRIAWEMQSAPMGLAGNHIHIDGLQTIIVAFLQERFAESAARAKRIAAEMLRQLRERNFILCLYGGGLYGFVHRSFLEYFCATAIQYRFEKTQDLSIHGLIGGIYGAHWREPEWHEVLRLTAGLIEPQFAADIIKYLATDAYPTWPKYFGSVPPRNLALAAECVAEVRNLKAVERAGEILLKRIVALLKHSNGVEDDTRNATLMEEIVPAVEAVGELWPGRQATRRWFFRDAAKLRWWPLSKAWCRMAAALYKSDPEMFSLLAGLLKPASSGPKQADTRQARAAAGVLGTTFNADLRVERLLRERAEAEAIDADIQAICIEELGACYGDKSETVELLFRILNGSGTELIRSACVRGLSMAIGPGKREGFDLFNLLASLGKEDRAKLVRFEALRCLGIVFDDHPEAFHLLSEAATTDKDATTRWGALESAARCPVLPEPKLRLLEQVIGTDAASDVRIVSVRVLELQEDLPQLARVKLLGSLARNDRNAEVRARALGALLVVGGERGHRVIASRDLDGVAPFLDPALPLLASHLVGASRKLGLSRAELSDLVDQVDYLASVGRAGPAQRSPGAQ